MKVLSKSLAAMVAAATLVEEGRLRLPALRMRLITMPLPVTPNPWYANSFDGWAPRWLGSPRHRQLGEESAITTNLGDDASKAKAVNMANSCANSSTSPSSVMKDWT